MEVQTYEATEATTEHRDRYEIEAEAEQLIEEMDLEGQKSLMVEDPETDTATRTPYEKMTQEQERVYGTLYPAKTDVEDYDKGPIPVRVLQIVSHGRELFDRMRVWHARTEDPDPVLVGTHDGDDFLLARWGDALAPFDDLYDRAIERKRDEWVSNAQEVMRECEAFISSPIGQVKKYMSGDWIHGPWT